ncbi:MAG: ABC transporter permease [Chloroflexi bacterium]|nr:ABC transporter permease [Chloroflexota bacterium]
MKSLRYVWFITLKDLKRFTTDRLALFFFVLFPFFFIIMFNFLLRGTGGSDARLELYLATQENQRGMSYQIIDSLVTKDDAQFRPGESKIVWLKDYEKARQDVDNKKIAGFLVFPADFTQGVLMGYGAHLEVVADAGQVNTRAALNGLAKAIASGVSMQQVAANTTIGLMVEQGMASKQMPDMGKIIQEFYLSQGDDSQPSIIKFSTDKVGDYEPRDPANWVIPGYLVMFVFFAAAQSAETIVRERQNHTLERLLTTSVSREAILVGVFLGMVAKGLVQIIVFWSVGIFVFKIDLGLSPFGVILLSVLMAITSAAFALMLATLTRTERSAGSLSVLTSLTMAPLGGSWWPLFITPKAMQSLAKITPHGWANTGFNKIMVFGGDFSSAVPEILALVVFALVFGIIAVSRFRMDGG